MTGSPNSDPLSRRGSRIGLAMAGAALAFGALSLGSAVPVSAATTTTTVPVTTTTVPVTTTTTTTSTTTTTTVPKTTTTVPRTTTTVPKTTTTTTTTPKKTSSGLSGTAVALIIVAIVVVLALILLLLLFSRRKRIQTQSAWRRAVFPAVSDAHLARDALLSANAMSDDAELRGSVEVQVDRSARSLEQAALTAPDVAAQTATNAVARCCAGWPSPSRPTASSGTGPALPPGRSWPKPMTPAAPASPSSTARWPDSPPSSAPHRRGASRLHGVRPGGGSGS